MGKIIVQLNDDTPVVHDFPLVDTQKLYNAVRRLYAAKGFVETEHGDHAVLAKGPHVVTVTQIVL